MTYNSNIALSVVLFVRLVLNCFINSTFIIVKIIIIVSHIVINVVVITIIM